MKVVKLPVMSKDEIIEALQSNNLCRIAFIDEDYPYISPFQYVYMNNHLYFHFTNYGKKMKIIEKNNCVCISIEDFKPNLQKYYFVSIQGNLIYVNDVEEKEKVLLNMVKNAKEKYSQNFLSAHGFKKEKGWDAFEVRNQIILKFIQKKEAIGLKSL